MENMSPTTVEFDKDIKHSSWFRSLSKYEQPDMGKAVGQLLNTFLPYFALWFLMVRLLQSRVSYWLIMPLAVVAAGLLVRIFIIFHDCCHGSFFGSRRANRILGYLSGILVFTPFEDWRRNHAGHHASSGDLDRRGTGDVWTLTVDEYCSASRLERLTYRVFRSAPFR